MIRQPRLGMFDHKSERHVRRVTARRYKGLRPLIEGLEDRVVLSTITWNTTAAPTGGAWDTPGNWIGNAVPTSTDTAVINLSASGTVTTGASDSVLSLTTNSSTTLTVAPGSLSLGSGSSTLGGPVNVQTGATLSVGTGANVQINSGVTLTDNGTVNITSPAVLAAQETNNNVSQGIVVNGTLTATNTSFTRNGGGVTSFLQVNSGGHLTATNSTFAWINFVLANGSVLNSGDLSNNIFTTTVSAPATDVPLLASNQSFQDIDLFSGSLNSGQTLSLVPIGTATTANQRYVFTGAFTVNAGATLSVGTGANVQINSGVTLTDNGTVNITSPAVLAAQETNNNVSQGIVVNGTLTATNTSFTRNGGGVTSFLQVNSGGHLTATNSTFAWINFVLANGSVLNSGDLSNNIFTTTVSAPATDVPLLASNQSFQDIDLFSGSLNSGQTLSLVPIGTATTANQRYVFTGAFTVNAGATLSVGTGANVQINSGVTLTDNGTVNITSPAVLAAQETNNNVSQGIVVNGTLTATNTSFTRNGGGVTSFLQVNSGGHLTATNSTFAWINFVLANGSVLNSGDLSNNIFATTVSAPATDVPLLASNQSFQDIDLFSGSLNSGQTLSLVPIGTATTANQRYVFTGAFTVNAGATLSVGTGANVQINSGVTLTDNGTVNITSPAVLAAQETNNNVSQGIVVNGTLTATNTSFTRNGGGVTSFLQVNSGGRLTESGGAFSWISLALSAGSTDTLVAVVFSGVLTVNSGATINIHGNDFSNVGAHGIVAVGDPTATIDMTANYWGTSNTSQIQAKILDHFSDPTRPTVNFGSFLNSPPSAITGVVFNDLNGDGVQDNGEPGLGGVVVYLDLNNSGTFESNDPSTTSNSTGQFCFDGLAAGTYIVRELAPAGTVTTDPSSAAVASTELFDNIAAGTTSFSDGVASFSGGTVFAPPSGDSALLASGTQAYNASSNPGEVDFSQPVSSASFFYVHGFGFAAGTATAFGVDGTVLGSVNSKAATTNGDPANFVTLSFAEPIARITFDGGVIDNFTFTTAANDQAYLRQAASRPDDRCHLRRSIRPRSARSRKPDTDVHRLHRHFQPAGEHERPQSLRRVRHVRGRRRHPRRPDHRTRYGVAGRQPGRQDDHVHQDRRPPRGRHLHSHPGQRGERLREHNRRLARRHWQRHPGQQPHVHVHRQPSGE